MMEEQNHGNSGDSFTEVLTVAGTSLRTCSLNILRGCALPLIIYPLLRRLQRLLIISHKRLSHNHPSILSIPVLVVQKMHRWNLPVRRGEYHGVTTITSIVHAVFQRLQHMVHTIFMLFSPEDNHLRQVRKRCDSRCQLSSLNISAKSHIYV